VTAVVTVCAASVFAIVWCMSGGAADARLRQDRVDSPGPRLTARLPVENVRGRLAVCAVSCMAIGWVVEGAFGALFGLPLGSLVGWGIGRLSSTQDGRAQAEIERDLPLAADLLAACAAVGRPIEEALRLVSASVGGELGDRLGAVYARLALGADPLNEWQRAASDRQIAPLAKALIRSLESGAPLASGLTRLADDCRRERRTRTQLRARNVGVQAAGPLALCFLPAFMLIGVVPTVAGAFADLVL